MLEPGGEPDLALEPIGPERGGELGEQDLEGDRAVVAEVLGQVDHGHAAAPELALEGVAVGEGIPQPVRHPHGAPGIERTTCMKRAMRRFLHTQYTGRRQCPPPARSLH